MTKDLEKLEKRLKIKFKNRDLLQQALIHRSYLNEHPEVKISHNERLEFLGDAIIEFIVTEFLYKNYQASEGTLTSWRASLVNMKILAQVAKKINLDKYLYLSRGEFFSSSDKAKMTILADAFEALIGAIYLDQGLKKTKEFIKKTIIARLNFILKHKLYEDAKSKFQELIQAKLKITPTYQVIQEKGPDHAKEFVVGLFLREKIIAQGRGRSKQEAEIEAAQKALKKYKKIISNF
ncbi:MAG: ribonuclease III [Patescibacteria group bacterium]|nr:ribonuclease III [Patescibacteria group bacterium]